MINNPYYVIDFSASSCFVDVRVNDVSVLFLNIEDNLASNIRINHAILKSGMQKVSYNVLPLAGEINLREGAKFRGILRLYDASGAYIEVEKDIDVYETPENKTNSLLPLHKYEASFLADVPYDLVDKSWLNSTDLNKIDGLRELLDKKYKYLESMFAAKQYTQFIQMIEARENNFAVSMYLDQPSKEVRVKELLETLKSSDYKVVPTSPLDIMFIHGNGKLVTLKKTDGCSAFLLKNSEDNELFIELKFHIVQRSNELSII